jgi:hypothetical protein
LFSRPVGQGLDLVAEGGGEQQALLLASAEASTFLMSWMKPMSSMRSASSSTRISTPDRSSVPCWPTVVEQAAGGGHQDVDAARRRSICGLMPTPPNITMLVSGRYLP